MAGLVTLYADPGYLSDGRDPQFPLGTVTEVRDAWAYLQTAEEYSESQLQRIRDEVLAAASRFRIELDEPEMAGRSTLAVNETLHETINALPDTGQPSVLGSVELRPTGRDGSARRPGIESAS